MRAIEVTAHGSADVLSMTQRPAPDPGPGEVRIAVEAAGINFADVMKRRGAYPGGPDSPYVPGIEAAGRIDAVGEGVDREVGDPVVAMLSRGGYAEYVVADADSLLPVPGSLSTTAAAGVPVQYLTAHCCLHEWGGLAPDERVLIHAAAGGVGTAAVQLADRAGATVFGTASTAEKRALAADLGADHTIDYESTDVGDAVASVTDGEGVDLVLDGVGGDAFRESLDALAHFGRVVAYGVASGDLAAADTTRLLFANQRVIGFHLGQAMRRDPNRVLSAVPDLTEALTAGEVEVVVGETFPLAEAAAAHRFVEDRESTGKVVLLP